MKRKGRLLLFALLSLLFSLHSPSAAARPIDADLDVRSVDIDHRFSGMDLLLYGARNDTGRIVIVLRGPDKRYLVRKKQKIRGIWVNRKSVEFEDVPGFYAAASTSALTDIRNDQLLEALNVGVKSLPVTVAEAQKGLKAESTVVAAREALIQHMQNSGLYRAEFSDISFMGGTLFRTWLEFPKNILRGWYTAEVFLFSDGQLSAVQTIPIHVSKIGFEALLYDSAHTHPLLYGIACALLALVAGWGGNRLFRRG